MGLALLLVLQLLPAQDGQSDGDPHWGEASQCFLCFELRMNPPAEEEAEDAQVWGGPLGLGPC